MKKTMKKILCLVMVLIMTVPFMAFGVSADDYVANYGEAADNGLIYKANFKGTSGFWSPKGGWAGMRASVAEDGSSVTLLPATDTVNSGKVNLWGECLPYPAFRILQSSYTTVFTVTAENENQEVGLFLDWKTGFAVTPGKDSYRYVDGKTQKAVTVTEGTYEGTKSLTQTYAIEIKDEGDENGGDKANFIYNVTEYNLYVEKDGAWVKIFSLKDAPTETANAIKNALNLDYDNYEFVLRLFRDGLNADQWDGITVSDLSVYKGLAVASFATNNDNNNDNNDNNDNNNTNNDNNSNTNNDNENTTTDTEAATEAATEAKTEAATKAVTEAADAKSGCGASIGICGAALVVASATGMLCVTRGKKKED